MNAQPNEQQPVQHGDEVEIEYVGKLEDGTVFDSTDGRGAFAFEAGTNSVIAGMSEAVLGMHVGEERRVEIAPEQAYGGRKDDLVIRIPRERIPDDAKVGDALSDGQPGGQVWYVAEMTPEETVLDGNHPLAGKTLIFEVRLVGIK
jgi:peptidylprolyl isomerase